MPKAYSYIRFSTPEQSKGDSLRRQTEAAAIYAQEHGLELDTELSFKDLGVSAYHGKNSQTGALSAFLRAVLDGRIAQGSYLLVESLDRISREAIVDAQAAFMSIVTNGIHLVTLKDQKVYAKGSINENPMDLIYSLVNLMRAHDESATKSMRLKAVYKHKREYARSLERSKPFTRRTPFWIEWSETEKKHVLIEDRSQIVRRVYEMADAGIGKHRISTLLNEEGVKPFGRAKFWHKSYVDKILNNPACAGTFVPTRKEEDEDRVVTRVTEDPILDYFPAAVPKDLYERVRAREKTVAPKGRHSGHEVSSVVAGVAKCGLCGSSFVRVCKGKYTYLVCSNANAKAGCEYLAVPYERVEHTLISHMSALITGAPTGNDTSQIEGALESLDEDLARLLSDAQFLTSEYRRTRSPTFATEIATLDARINAKRAELKELREERDAVSSIHVVARLDALREAFSARPFAVAAANLALKACVKTLEFDPRSSRIGVEWSTGSWDKEGIPFRTRHLYLSGFDDESGA